jgi:hypothetical protein
MATWFGASRTTICGRSTAAGTDTGPTATEESDLVAAGFASEFSV